MILQIAVNTSMLFLKGKKIYCTEPFRIPLAGKADYLAFDKTGTLTSEKLVFKGIVDELENYQDLKKQTEASTECQCILSGCHSLMYSEKENKLTGDPIEMLFFDCKSWQYNTTQKTASYNHGEMETQILKAFPFKSDLRRMSTVVRWKHGEQIRYRCLTKGAPEIIEQLLSKPPANFSAVYQYYTKKGYRVLALAWKDIELAVEEVGQLERGHLEFGLKFAGLVISSSPLKRDTARQIQQFKDANLKLTMITGDNVLTAIAVGRQLKFHSQQRVLILEMGEEDQFFFQDDDGKNRVDVDKNFDYGEGLRKLVRANMLVTTGRVLDSLFQREEKKAKNAEAKRLILQHVLKHIVVFARASPDQKEMIVARLQHLGHHVIMCGDGTNDAGALKKSDAGIAIVGGQELSDKEYAA